MADMLSEVNADIRYHHFARPYLTRLGCRKSSQMKYSFLLRLPRLTVSETLLSRLCFPFSPLLRGIFLSPRDQGFSSAAFYETATVVSVSIQCSVADRKRKLLDSPTNRHQRRFSKCLPWLDGRNAQSPFTPSFGQDLLKWRLMSSTGLFVRTQSQLSQLLDSAEMCSFSVKF